MLRLHQISTAKDDFTKFYPTLTHYRDAASHRCTHKKLLRIIHKLFKKEVEKLPNKEGRSTLTNNQNNNNLRRSRPQRVRFQGQIINETLEYAPSKTFQTPSKNKKNIINEGRGAEQIQHRTANCSGFPFEVVDQGLKTKDQRHKCFVCGNKTKWMCIKCRFYFLHGL